MKKQQYIFTFVIFFIYLVAVFYVTIFSKHPYISESGEYRYNLNLNFIEFLIHNQFESLTFKLKNIGGNFVMFIPLGFLVPILINKSLHNIRMSKIWITTFIGALLSLVIELIQLFTYYGIFDINDIVLNVLGTTGGFLLLYSCKLATSARS